MRDYFINAITTDLGYAAWLTAAGYRRLAADFIEAAAFQLELLGPSRSSSTSRNATRISKQPPQVTRDQSSVDGARTPQAVATTGKRSDQ